MNKAEAQIAVRDRVLANVLNAFVGDGIGQAYFDAITQADAEVAAALKEKLGNG